MSVFGGKECVICLLMLLAISQSCNAALKSLLSPDPVDPRIINGTVVKENDAKYQVSLRRRLNDGYFYGTGHFCGGSLIAYNVVLTSAHCFVDQDIYNGTYISKEDVIVVAGNLNRFEVNHTLVFDIKELIVYSSIFNVTSYENDIALLILNDSIPVDHLTITPIAVAFKAVAVNTTCQVTGWGKTEEDYLSEWLMTVDVPIISTEVCKNSSNIAAEQILDGMMCAGYMEGERDACQGDSGGPMVCNNEQAGIVSWGYSCAIPMLPGIYTNVTHFMPWITDNLNARNITLYRNAAFSIKGSINIVVLLILVWIRM